MEQTQEYPYIFQSGKYRGKTLEWVFVNDPLHVSQIYRNMFYRRFDSHKKVNNKLQLAIENLKEKILKMEIVKVCPFCKKEKVHFFLLPDCGAINTELVCCQREDCQQELKTSRPGELYKIDEFLLVLPYLRKKEAKTIIKIFKKAHPAFLLAELA